MKERSTFWETVHLAAWFVVIAFYVMLVAGVSGLAVGDMLND